MVKEKDHSLFSSEEVGPMGNCILCIHSTFDEKLGKWVCKSRREEIYILLDSTECKFYTNDPAQVN